MKKVFLSIFLFSLIVAPSFVQAEAISTQSIQDLINIERTKAGIPALSVNALLVQAAQNKANDMVARNYFEHTSPTGKPFYQWIKEAGYTYHVGGENLAVNTETLSNTAIIEAWMNSSSHRENLLASKYTETGIAMVHGVYEGKPAVFVVQMFASPALKQSFEVANVPPAQVSTQAVASAKFEPGAQTTGGVVKAGLVNTTSASVVAAAETDEYLTTSPEPVADTAISTEIISETSNTETEDAPKSLIQRLYSWFLKTFNFLT